MNFASSITNTTVVVDFNNLSLDKTASLDEDFSYLAQVFKKMGSLIGENQRNTSLIQNRLSSINTRLIENKRKLERIPESIKECKKGPIKSIDNRNNMSQQAIILREIAGTIIPYLDIPSLIAVSSTSKYWYDYCNRNLWNKKKNFEIDKYISNIFDKCLLHKTSYVYYLFDGHLTDLVWIAIKIGIVAFPFISFYNARQHYNNIPPDAPIIFKEVTDENGDILLLEMYDHPEYFASLYSFISGILGMFPFLGLVMNDTVFSLGIESSGEIRLRELKKLDDIISKKISLFPFANYISPPFLDWQIERMSQNRKTLNDFKLKLENKIKGENL